MFRNDPGAALLCSHGVLFFLNVCVLIVLLASNGRDENWVEVGAITVTLDEEEYMRRAEGLAGIKQQWGYKANPEHVHGPGEEENPRTPLEMSFSSLFS